MIELRQILFHHEITKRLGMGKLVKIWLMINIYFIVASDVNSNSFICDLSLATVMNVILPPSLFSLHLSYIFFLGFPWHKQFWVNVPLVFPCGCKWYKACRVLHDIGFSIMRHDSSVENINGHHLFAFYFSSWLHMFTWSFSWFAGFSALYLLCTAWLLQVWADMQVWSPDGHSKL